MSKMVYSGMLTPDGTLLESLYRHDYQGHQDKNGKYYMIDGGNDYIHSSANGDERFITLYDTDPWWLIRKFKKRLNQRRNEWVAIENIDDEWLDAIISFYMDTSINPYYKEYAEVVILYLKEKQYRNVETEVF